MPRLPPHGNVSTASDHRLEVACRPHGLTMRGRRCALRLRHVVGKVDRLLRPQLVDGGERHLQVCVQHFARVLSEQRRRTANGVGGFRVSYGRTCASETSLATICSMAKHRSTCHFDGASGGVLYLLHESLVLHLRVRERFLHRVDRAERQRAFVENSCPLGQRLRQKPAPSDVSSSVLPLDVMSNASVLTSPRATW